MAEGFYNRLKRKLKSVSEQIRFGKKAAVIKKNTLLLLKLDSIGDYVLFRNFIQFLKKSEKYKNYSITICGNQWWKELAEQLDAKLVDEFIWVDYPRMSDFNYRNEIYKKIHSRGFEVLLHPTYSRDSISDAVVNYSGAKEKIGYDGDCVNLTIEQKQKNDLFYTRLIPSLHKYEFEFFRNKDFFEQLTSEKVSIQRPLIERFTEIENKIVICPGAKDAFRRWSTANFKELCRKLQPLAEGCDFVICGSGQDTPMAKEIMENSDIPFTDLTGKLSLFQLVQVMSEAKLVIANDSGPFHIAIALDRKTVCLSNGNNYGRFTPYPVEMGTKSKVIYPEQLLVLAEEQRLEKFCRQVKNVDINEINVETVLAEIKQLL